MDWFSERSLRLQWRLAQAVLALPIFGLALFLVVMAVRAVADPAGAWAILLGRLTEPASFLAAAISVLAVLAIDRHLRPDVAATV